MSALLQEASVCVCGSEHLCECGCGRPLEAPLYRVHQLAAGGATTASIAALLDISTTYVKRIKNGTYAPRFVKGHSVRAQPKPVVSCAGCGRPFRKMGPNHIYCTSSSQTIRPGLKGNAECAALHWQQSREFWEEHDRGVLEREVERREQWERPKRLARLLKQETNADWFVAERERIDREIVERGDELTELLYDQVADERFGHKAAWWQIYGDAPLGPDGAGTIFSRLPADGADPFEQLVSREILAVIGGRDLDAIERLDELTLHFLRSKLVESGLVDISVMEDEERRAHPQAKERFVRHRDVAERTAQFGGLTLDEIAPWEAGRKRGQRRVRESQRAVARIEKQQRQQAVAKERRAKRAVELTT